jgi:hypothetical protein
MTAPVTDSVGVSAVGNARVAPVGVPVHVRHAWEGGDGGPCGGSQRRPDPDIPKTVVVPGDEVSRDEHHWNDQEVADHVHHPREDMLSQPDARAQLRASNKSAAVILRHPQNDRRLQRYVERQVDHPNARYSH